MNSLRFTLGFWLLSLSILVGFVAGVTSYQIAAGEARGSFDLQLRLIALNVDPTAASAARVSTDVPAHDPEDDFIVQAWDTSGQLIRVSPTPEPIPRPSATGWRDVTTGTNLWRSYALFVGGRAVQVSQLALVRDELASTAAWQSLVPTAVFVPLALLALGLVMRVQFRRLDRIAEVLSAQRPQGFRPIDLASAPSEIQPFVGAVNDVMGRMQESIVQQKRFVADAAHALRTPLAALQLHFDNLRHSVDAGERQRRIDDADRGLGRATQLVQQLLRMAESENAKPSKLDPIDLAALVRNSLAEVLTLAESRGQDLGMVRADPGLVLGEPDDLRSLVGNLLENAIRHTPDKGTIDVAVMADRSEIVLEIYDSGPGIPDDELALVFQPFHRAANVIAEGSGLGLSIVSAIAERQGARVGLANRADSQGLIVKVAMSRHDKII